MRSAKHFHSPCEKRFRQRRFHIFIGKFFIVVHFAVPNFLAFRDGSFEVFGDVENVRIQSIRVVILLIVEVHFNIGKNWTQNVVYMSNERNWRLLLLLRCRFLIRFCLFLVLLFYFFSIVNFVTTTSDKFQFPSQKRLSQINVLVPVRLKLKLYAVFIKWSSRIDSLFMGRQGIDN